MKHDIVLITGASSGLGRSLALTLARPGRTLHLGGRNQDRLHAVAQHCISRGAAVDVAAHDVADRTAMAHWVKSTGTLDMVLACAGITGVLVPPPHQTAPLRTRRPSVPLFSNQLRGRFKHRFTSP
ncbi:dehydrogenase [Acetobacter orientalis]|uniref:Dehydrogenase n=1 Tax=Acetobacter orientalis TaxID=146474 RepID=A0A2Z5ZGD0_9PROT|nr:dehydrogenase [Acetobacter orientalis]